MHNQHNETPADGQKKPQRQLAYEGLRKAILTGRFSPGSPLSEPQLATWLNLSRTPIREALVNLRHEGLVVLVPGRGVAVARISLEDAVEIYQVREVLEGMAARLAAERVPLVEIERMERVFDNLEASIVQGHSDPVAESTIGQEFHQLIMDAARNQRIASILNQMNGQFALAFSLAAVIPGRIRKSVHQHREILAALRARDSSAAELAMRRHLASTIVDMMRFAMESWTEPEILAPMESVR